MLMIKHYELSYYVYAMHIGHCLGHPFSLSLSLSLFIVAHDYTVTNDII